MENSKEKKKMNGFVKFLIFIATLVLIIFIGLKVYLPDLFHPKDLGVKANIEAYNRVLTKLNYQVNKISMTLKYGDYNHIYGPSNKINDIFTSEEITSFINVDQPKYANIKNVQIRINEDNSLSLSASVNINEVLKEIEYIPKRYRNKDNLPVGFAIPDIVNVYMKCSGTFSNNKVINFNITEFELMGYDVMIYIKQNYGIDILEAEINDQLDNLFQVMGLYIERGIFKDSNFIFKGNFPSSYTVEKK